MPNWCENELQITGKEAELQKFIAENFVKNEESGKSELSFNAAVPEPAHVGDSWYDWRVKNWGTKWDIADVVQSVEPCRINLFFSTAWAPPSPWLEVVATRYPKLKFILSYDEPGMDFAGKEVFENGIPDLAASWEGESLMFAYCSANGCDEYLEDSGISAAGRDSSAVQEFYCEDHKLAGIVKEHADL